MQTQAFDNGLLRVTVEYAGVGPHAGFALAAVEVATPGRWEPVLSAFVGQEFATSLGAAAADTCQVRQAADGGWEIEMVGRGDGWEAREVISLPLAQPWLRRKQTYRFLAECEASICPGFRLQAESNTRYTLALRAHEQPLAGLPPMRPAVDWALPLPFHVWHNQALVALYGLDKRTSPGTLDFTPVDADGDAGLHVYYPDTEVRLEGSDTPPGSPGLIRFEPGAEVTITEIIAARPLAASDEPLLEAERIAASILLREPPRGPRLEGVAAGIASFWEDCQLWEPDALGVGRGWFSNMWVRTQTGPAAKRGEMSGYFDLGWGEGIAVEMWAGMVGYWRRTGDARLLRYVDGMASSIDLFRRGSGPNAAYFDRSDGERFGDFLMDVCPGSRIWTHSLGHTGSQLLQLYQVAPDYPCPQTRQHWLAAATSMAGFLRGHQRPDGDLQDIFGEDDRELNDKPHRVTARAVVCGLWTRLGQLLGNPDWVQRALRLAEAVAPEIDRYEYYNQMLDGIASPHEFADGEAAYYVLEGLVPLYVATGDTGILTLCKQAAAFGIAWTYFYDLPKAHRGIARGGQCCRMDDLPLLYPIGPAKAVPPLLALHAATGDPLFEQMAHEMVTFISNWQMDDAGQPWHGGIIHALGQYCGKHWGPGLAGQVDTGMATGNSLAAIELWLAHEADREDTG